MFKYNFNGLHLLFLVTLIALLWYSMDRWLKFRLKRDKSPRYRNYTATRYKSDLAWRVNLKTREVELSAITEQSPEWEKSFFVSFADIEKALYDEKLREVENESIHS